jgi:hypothetical protein
MKPKESGRRSFLKNGRVARALWLNFGWPVLDAFSRAGGPGFVIDS